MTSAYEPAVHMPPGSSRAVAAFGGSSREVPNPFQPQMHTDLKEV